MKFKSKQKGQILLLVILLKISVVLSFLLFSEVSNAATCYEFGYSTTNSETGRIYQVYYDDGLPLSGCTFDVVLTTQEYARFELLEQQNSETVTITSLDIAESFTWGFGTYIGFWFLGFVIKNARMVIRKA